jgi:hypothetical protein
MPASNLSEVAETFALLLVSANSEDVARIFLGLAASAVPIPETVRDDYGLMAQIIRLVHDFQNLAQDKETADRLLEQVDRDARRLADEFNGIAKETIDRSF